MKCLFLSFISLMLISITTSAEPAQQVRIYIENYEISAILYAEIMAQPNKSNNNDSALRNSLLKQVKNKTASLLSNHLLITRNSERAVTETIKEMIYPVEYEPPGKTFPDKPKDPFIKTHFETRNLGVSLLIEPTIKDQYTELKMNFEYVRFLKNIKYAEINTLWTKLSIEFPIFYTKRISTQILLEDGKFLHSHSYSPEINGEIDSSKVILTFVRADQLRSGK